MAIHDAAYASPPQSWRQYRWRLQHLAEERIGKAVRQSSAHEEAEAAALIERF